MGEKLLRICFDKIDGFTKTDNGIIDIQYRYYRFIIDIL